MSTGSNTFNGMMEQALLELNTAFIAKIVKMDGADKCSVQPLDKTKAYGKAAKTPAVIPNVPILNHVRRYTLVKQDLSVNDTYTGGGSISPSRHPVANNVGHVKVEPLKAGDLVFCVCAQRDISSAINGASTVPPVGHHKQKDAVVVGLIGGWPHE